MIGYLPYIIYGTLGLALSALEIRFFKKKFRILSILFLLVVFFFMAVLRSTSVGIDTIQYSNFYNISVKSGVSFFNYISSKKPEFIFYGTLYLFSNINLPEKVFWAFNYSIISVFLFLTFKDKKHGVSQITFLMFFGFQMMSYSGIRQAIAISASLFLINKLIENIEHPKRWKWFLIYYVLSIMLIGYHVSSIVLLFLPPLFLIKMKRTNIIFPIFLLLFIPSILSGLSLYLYAFFRDGYYTPNNNSISISFILSMLLFVIYYFLSCGFLDKFLHKYIPLEHVEFSRQSTAFVILFYGYLVCISLNIFGATVVRVAMYFYPGVIFIIFELVDMLKIKWQSSLFKILVLIFFFGYYIFTLKNLGVVPYAIG